MTTKVKRDPFDPTTWAALYITTRRSDEPGSDTTGDMDVVVQGSVTGLHAEDWPIITRLRGYQPMRYAQAVLTAAVQAQYEEMLWGQLSHRLGMEEQAMAMLLVELRELRPVIPDGWTAPLRFTPIFGQASRKGLVTVSYRGIDFTQWSYEDTAGHGRAVVEAAAAAPLDAMYYRYLIDSIGLDKALASTVVVALGAEYRSAGHRQPEAEGGEPR